MLWILSEGRIGYEGDAVVPMRLKCGAAIVAILATWASPGFSNETITYSYDALGRLVATTTSGTINNAVNTNTSFDPAGNRTNYAVSGVNTPTNATISIGSASITEGGILVFTVTRSGVTTSAVSANYASASGTATSGADFTAASGTVSFAANETSKTISVSTIDDAAVESVETMTLTLSTPSAGAVLGTAIGTGTINDNDVPPPPSFAVGNASPVTEGGTLVYTVTKTGSASASFSVNFATADGTAISGSDFNPNSGTLTFLASDVTKTVSVTTIDDALLESAETVLLNLSAPTGGSTITTSQGSGAVNDNDTLPPPSFAISAAPSVTEGGSLVYTVTKTGATNTSFTVNFASASGTATAGSDYTANSGTLTFLTGDTSKTISIATIDDAVVEGAETVLVNLSAPSGGSTITTSQGSGTINDNDLPPPTFTVSDVSIVEGGVLAFAVSRSAAAISTNFSVNYATADGTATSASDYTAASGTLTFTPGGATSQTVNVSTVQDTAVEANETLLLNLSGATGGATIADAQGVGTINNDDAVNQPPVAVSDGTLSVQKCQIKQITVTANDTDPEGNLPITLLSINGQTNYGAGTADVYSTTQIQYTANEVGGQTDTVTYTIRDSLGATSTGTLPVSVTNTGFWCPARPASSPGGN